VLPFLFANDCSTTQVVSCIVITDRQLFSNQMFLYSGIDPLQILGIYVM